MKDLIFITAYCPTENQVNMLEKCIDSVLKCDKHVALISHSHIPIHIQKKCNFYFYDYMNDTNQDDDLLYFTRYVISDDLTIRSKYFTKEFYGFAIYRMFCIASQIAINFGYKRIHHIEYDCVLKNNELIEYHNELLEEHDAVLYTDTGDENGFIFGAFKSFNVDTLPKLFTKYNKDMMKDIMVNTPLLPLESFTKHIFLSETKPVFLNTNKIKENQNFFQNETPLRLKYFTPYYEKQDDTFNLFYKNIGDVPHELRVYVNGVMVYDDSIQPNWWTIIKLCDSSKLQSLLILWDDKIIYDKKYGMQNIENLKINSYSIRNEKNN